MSEELQEAAAPACEHYWAHHCYRGLSVRLCKLCHEPDWNERAQEKADRDRLWRCLFDAQNHWINAHDGEAHAGWQVTLVQTGAPT